MQFVRHWPAIVLMAAVLITGQAWAGEKGAWKKASNGHTVASYQKYLQKHPDGAHVQAAHEAIEELRFEAAKRRDTQDGYEEFLARYPSGARADELSDRLVRLRYLEAVGANDIESYEAFLRRHPTTSRALSAFHSLRPKYVERERARVAAAWSAALEEGTIDALERFLVENRGSPYIADARRRFEELGRDPLMAEILVDSEDYLRERNELDKIDTWLAVSIRAVIATREPTHLVFKDSKRRYQKVTGDRIEPLPPDYELLALRFAPPWRVAVLFLNPEDSKFTPEAPLDSFRVSDVFLEYFDALCEVEQAERGLSKLWIDVPDAILRPEDRPVDGARGRALLFALNASAPADAAILDVRPRRSPANTEAVRSMIDALAGMIGTSDEEAERRAVAHLLSLNEPSAVEAIRSANPSRALPLNALLAKGTPEARRWACERLGRPVGDDLTGLARCGYVEVEGKGSDIGNVSIRVRRLTDEPIEVVIPAGTLFSPDSADYQSMVSRAPETVRLEDDEWTTVRLRAACANRLRDIPTDRVGLDVSMKPPDPELSRVMPALAESEASFDVAQAAVWIVTDDASYRDLGTLRSGGRRKIDVDEAAQAMHLLQQAGIDVCAKRIRGDRDWLLERLGDGAAKTWLATLSCAP